jgi:hypothetical protein
VFSVNVPGKITDKCMVSISQSLVWKQHVLPLVIVSYLYSVFLAVT